MSDIDAVSKGLDLGSQLHIGGVDCVALGKKQSVSLGHRSGKISGYTSLTRISAKEWPMPLFAPVTTAVGIMNATSERYYE